MTSPLWQRSDGELLKALREKAGLDVVVLARLGTMTVHQVRGLEDGEGGEFYSPAIKAHMGRALLAKLGYVPAPAEAVLADVPDAAPADPVPVVAPDPAPLRQASIPAPAEPRPDKPRRLGPPAGYALAGIGLLLAGLWLLSQHKPWAQRSPAAVSGAATPPPAASSAEGTSLTAGAPALAARSAQDAPPVTVVTTAPAPAPAPAVTPAAPSAPAAVAAAATTDPACSVAESRPGLTFTPSEPRKAGTFVHLVADKPVRLCVLDAAQRATRLELEPGVGRSVAGAAPFVVRGELGHLKIFFQGVRVQGDLAAGTQVVLNEAPLR